MPYCYYPGKYLPKKHPSICCFSLDILRDDNNNGSGNKLKPIVVSSNFDIENGLTGMNSSINIRLMKHIGCDSIKIRSVLFYLIKIFFYNLLILF
jgi:hypothetical protein